MVVKERGVEVKQSRLSFLYTYVLVALVLIFFLMVWKQFNLIFTLAPQNFSELSKSFIVLGFVGLAAALLEEPEIRRLFTSYLITNNEVIKIEGIIRKRKTIIPYQSVANVSVYKNVLGRILNFGDIDVLGFKDEINMNGIREPDVFYRIINNKIAMMRGTKKSVVSDETGRDMDTGKEKAKDWKKDQRELEKTVHTPRMTGGRKGLDSKMDIFGFLKKSKEASRAWSEARQKEKSGLYEREESEIEKRPKKRSKKNKRKQKKK